MWVKTTFEKEYIAGSRQLFDTITGTHEHGVKINHKPEWDFLVYGNLVAYEADMQAARVRKLITGETA